MRGSNLEPKTVLEAFGRGELGLDEALERLGGVVDLGWAKLDWDRKRRTGFSEVVYGASKSLEQLLGIILQFQKFQNPLLVTRIKPELAEALLAQVEGLHYDPYAHTLTGQWSLNPAVLGSLAIVTAGTADLPVAQEASAVARFFGAKVDEIYDVGVAGAHRLLSQLERIKTAQVVIVIAGMDGALPSLVGGLIEAPLIAVPTSVGYGANFAGLAPLLAMLNSCAAGVSVVNIDNGFGAALAAVKILRMVKSMP